MVEARSDRGWDTTKVWSGIDMALITGLGRSFDSSEDM